MIESPARFGKYEVRALLGQGAMGQVYLCHDPVIDRQVAVKILHPHILADRHADEMRNRFRREARAAARCQHPNIVTVYDVGDHEGRDYIVMEYVQGEELRFFLERGERLGDAERLYIVREVLEALGFAHARGVVHRDVKPANIILTDEGGVKVADFGVARIDRSDLTQAGSLMGTPTYMAPEGLRGEPVGPRGDLYSVGMVLFELVTGRRPAPEHIHSGRVGEFVATTLDSTPALPESLASVIRRALAPSPEQRFDSADAFREALGAVRVEVERPPREALSETVFGREPLSIGEVVPESDSFRWPEDWLQQVAGLLSKHLGPMASMLVRSTAGSARDASMLGELLAERIPDMKDRSLFLKQYQACAASLSHALHGSLVDQGAHPTSDSRSAATGPIETGEGSLSAVMLDADRFDALRALFAGHVGPLAGSLIQHHLQRAGSTHDLVEKLAARIPDLEEREAFSRQAVRLLMKCEPGA